MSLRNLAARNIWQNRGRYLAYLGSSALAVMIYFLYMSLALHPHFDGEYRGARYVAEATSTASVVIPMFMLVFLLYSGAAFVRSRMKEFGLFTLLGLTRRQLVRMILWEQALIAGASIALGLATGLLFLKLFFMVVSVLLRLPAQLPIYIAWPVWRQTLMVFGCLYVVVSLLSLRGVLRRNIIELIRAGRKPKETPLFSPWKAALGLSLVVGGYVWASQPNMMVIIAGILPVTVMVSIGTYLLMRESSIALLSLLRRIRGFYHRPGPFLTVSHLTFKIQENYRMLSTTAVFVAIILTAVGTIFSFYMISETDARTATPQALQLRIPDGVPADEHIAFAQRTLEDHGVQGLQLVKARVPYAMVGQIEAIMVPYSFYAALYRPQGETLELASDDAAIRVFAHALPKASRPDATTHRAELHIMDETIPLMATSDYSGRLFNNLVADVLVLSDRRFEQIVADHPRAEYRTVAIWTGPGWRARGMRDAIAELRLGLAETQVEMSTTLETYQSKIGEYGLALFMGVFASLAFFAATCSLLYFRLFTEIDDDRRYYNRLRQLGLSGCELKRLSRVQAMIVFFIPFLVGLVHSTFAMKALGTLVGISVLLYGWMVAAGYLVLYVGFFLATYALYWKSMGLGRTETVAEPVGA